MRTKVVVLENEQLLGSLLALWINGQKDLDLLGYYNSHADLIASQGSWVADVGLIVSDIVIDERDGIEAIKSAVARTNRHVPIVFVADRATVEDAQRLRQDFDHGWALISRARNDLSNLRHAIDAAMKGFVTIDPVFTNPVLSEQTILNLSPQERDILGALADGLSNQAIAEQLFLSVKSVERIISVVYTKLGLEDVSKHTNPRVLAALIFHDAAPALRARLLAS